MRAMGRSERIAALYNVQRHATMLGASPRMLAALRAENTDPKPPMHPDTGQVAEQLRWPSPDRREVRDEARRRHETVRERDAGKPLHLFSTGNPEGYSPPIRRPVRFGRRASAQLDNAPFAFG